MGKSWRRDLKFSLIWLPEVNAEYALEAAHAGGGALVGMETALVLTEVAGQAARKNGNAVAGRLGYLGLELWSATIAAAHREYSGL